MKKRFRISRYSVFYHAAVLAGSGTVLQILGFFYRMMQSRLIGAEGMGMYSLIQPVYALIVSVSLSGICMAVNHLAAQADARGSFGALPRIFRSGALFFVILFTGMASLLILFRDPLAERFLGRGEAGRAMLLFLPCIFLTGFENLCKNACYGLKEVREPAISEISEQVIRIAAVFLILLLLKPASPLACAECVILGMTASEVFSSLFMTLRLGAILRKKGEEGPPFPRKIGRSLLRIALPVSASAILGNLISSAVTLTLPARLALAGLGESEALSDIGRINAMAAPFMSLPLTFVHPVGAAVTPRITGSLARGERADAARKGARNLETAGLIAVPLSFLLVPVGPYLVESLFGVEIGERTLALLAAGTVFASYQAAASAVLMGYGRHRFAMLSGLAGGAVHFLLMWRLSSDPAFGVEGQVIGIAAGALVSALLNGGMLLFGLKIRLPAGRTFLRPLLIAVPAALCEKTAFRLLGGRLAGTVAGIAAGAVVTALLMRVCGYRVRAYLETLVPGAQNEAGSKSFRTPPQSAEEAADAAAFTASFRKEASPGSKDAGSSAERESRK